MAFLLVSRKKEKTLIRVNNGEASTKGAARGLPRGQEVLELHLPVWRRQTFPSPQDLKVSSFIFFRGLETDFQGFAHRPERVAGVGEWAVSKKAGPTDRPSPKQDLQKERLGPWGWVGGLQEKQDRRLNARRKNWTKTGG